MKQSNLNFTDPVLTFLEFHPNTTMSSEESEGYSVENEFEIDVSRKENYNEAMVTLGLSIRGVDATLFTLNAKMTSIFSWGNEDFTEEEINFLLTKNAPSLLLSYLRPIIATVTNASPYPVYNLPFVDLRNEDS